MIYRGWPIENWILHSYVKLPKAIIDDSSPTCLESRHISYIWVCLEIGHPLSNGSSLSIMFHHVSPYLSSNLGEYQILGHPHMVNQLNKRLRSTPGEIKYGYWAVPHWRRCCWDSSPYPYGSASLQQSFYTQAFVWAASQWIQFCHCNHQFLLNTCNQRSCGWCVT